jgi:hypothetical protein
MAGNGAEGATAPGNSQAKGPRETKHIWKVAWSGFGLTPTDGVNLRFPRPVRPRREAEVSAVNLSGATTEGGGSARKPFRARMVLPGDVAWLIL